MSCLALAARGIFRAPTKKPAHPYDRRFFDESNAGHRHELHYTEAPVTIVDTGHGALIDTAAVIGGLNSQCIGYLGLDVHEEALFFRGLSSDSGNELW